MKKMKNVTPLWKILGFHIITLEMDFELENGWYWSKSMYYASI